VYIFRAMFSRLGRPDRFGRALALRLPAGSSEGAPLSLLSRFLVAQHYQQNNLVSDLPSSAPADPATRIAARIKAASSGTVGGTSSRIYDVCRGYCGVVRLRKTRSQTMKQTSKLTKTTACHFDTLNDPSHACHGALCSTRNKLISVSRKQ
jgi:hypothetical protein